jgi:hypothetical protein
MISGLHRFMHSGVNKSFSSGFLGGTYSTAPTVIMFKIGVTLVFADRLFF